MPVRHVLIVDADTASVAYGAGALSGMDVEAVATPVEALDRVTVSAFDAVLFVTPEYNGGYPSTLKNAIDVLFWEWQNKPAAVVTTGGGGGRKCDDQLRQVLSAVQMDVVQQRVQVRLPKEYTYTSQRVIPSEQHDTFLVQYRDTVRYAFRQLIDKIK